MKTLAEMSQSEMVLYHIEKFGSITDRDAVYKYGIMRLGSVVHSLRKKGFNIITTMQRGKNRFKKVVPYAVYTLEEN